MTYQFVTWEAQRATAELEALAIEQLYPVTLEDLHTTSLGADSTCAREFRSRIKEQARASTETLRRIWGFVDTRYSDVTAQSEALLKEATGTRIALEHFRTNATPKVTQLEHTGEVAWLLDTVDQPELLRHALDDFLTIRRAVRVRYFALLGKTAHALIQADVPNEACSVAQLGAHQIGIRQPLVNLNPESIAVLFPGYRIASNAQKGVYSVAYGHQQIQTNGVTLPTVESDQFIECLSQLRVNLTCRDIAPETTKTFPLLTLEQITALVDTAESLLRQVQSRELEWCSKTIEGNVFTFDEQTQAFRRQLEKFSTDEAFRTLGRAVLKERLVIATLLTAWSGPFFLRMEGLTLRLCRAVLELCRQHLKGYDVHTTWRG